MLQMHIVGNNLYLYKSCENVCIVESHMSEYIWTRGYIELKCLNKLNTTICIQSGVPSCMVITCGGRGEGGGRLDK